MDLKNQDLLNEYANNFYGYGNLESDYWLIGMEEGGGTSEEEIISRISVWDSKGRPTLLDNYEFHKAITDGKGNSLEHLFKGRHSSYQRTWGGLIKIIKSFEGDTDLSPSRIKEYQSDKLGRKDSNNCLLEVFPLPSPSTKEFKYNEWTTLDYLRSRDTYKKHLESTRVYKLKELIGKHRPKIVLFYSSSLAYVEQWSKISGIDFFTTENELIHDKSNQRARFHQSNGTQFAVIHHPTYKGVGNIYFKSVGHRLRTNQFGLRNGA